MEGLRPGLLGGRSITTEVMITLCFKMPTSQLRSGAWPAKQTRP